MKDNLTYSRREEFYAELHALLSAGLDFSQAFQLLIQEESQNTIKKLLGQLYSEVVGGAALWQAMEHIGAFDALDYGVVRIGEQTGRLADTLDFLRDYYHKQSKQRRMIISAISYPLVVLTMAVAVAIFMLIVIVPMFEQVYARMGGELPVLTQWVIAASKSLPRHTIIFGIIGSLLALLLYLNRSRSEVQLWRSIVLLRLPIVGKIICKNYQAQFCKLLYLLTSSGIPLLSGVKMLEQVILFPPYQHSFAQICKDLEQGDFFATGIAKFPQLYDRKLSTLIRVGEETNSLPAMLQRQGDAITDELEVRIRRMGTLLEPLLIMLVGLLVAIILISMYMPMFKLGGTMIG